MSELPLYRRFGIDAVMSVCRSRDPRLQAIAGVSTQWLEQLSHKTRYLTTAEFSATRRKTLRGSLLCVLSDSAL
jgi:hypothetical protein